jgi:hypothetical protein
MSLLRDGMFVGGKWTHQDLTARAQPATLKATMRKENPKTQVPQTGTRGTLRVSILPWTHREC